MLETRFAIPAEHLRPFIRFYVQRKVGLRGEPLVHPVTARSGAIIEFDFADPVRTYVHREATIKPSPPVSIVGPQTFRRLDLRLHGTLDSFVIMFQPAGLHRLFSIPMQEFADQDHDAHAVLGPFVTRLWQRLGDAQSFQERVRLVESWLPAQRCPFHDVDGVSTASNRIVMCGGRISIRSLVEQTGISLRQFERRFLQQVGLGPKLLARIARFEAALEEKGRRGAKSWTDIAHEFGYYDQSHMNQDFIAFAGETPTEALRHLTSLFAEHLASTGADSASEGAARNSDLIL